MTKEEGRVKVAQLIEKFKVGRDEYMSRSAKMETGIRRELLDPLFFALGWDVDNSLNLTHQLKEVTHEYSLSADDDTRLVKPDYAFSLNAKVHFFVEAKDSSIVLSKNNKTAFQLQSYSWNAGLPLGILTDFEEFVVFDCRKKPELEGAAQRGRHFYCTFEQYLDRWDEIYDLYSKEAVAGGSIDTFRSKELRGAQTVDAVFLARMDAWRKLLAEEIHNNNPEIGKRALNQAVQTILDRIIFLRICEDREIEDYGKLQNLIGKQRIYAGLRTLFEAADARYNSGLFHFKPEKGRGDVDSLTPELTIGDKPLDTILKGLYYPEPFAFAAMPADILGQVYERFLGKVIEIGEDGKVAVEDKPEVKKAGGVFYTPEYIVDYIVKNTVGRLVDGKKPDDVAKLKILDPACGSGAFLIKAYQFLLEWHFTYYTTANKTDSWEKNKRLMKDERGAYRLSLSERKRILLVGIHGVDIDSQAVEVTRLSLLLKCLEGETKRTIQPGLWDGEKRILPDLDKNIQCGNSLIGRDFYQATQGMFFEREEKLRINAFDWQTEFKGIIDRGGFDAVIGNPPYIRIQALKEWAPEAVEFYRKHYESAIKGNYDIYVVFIEKGLSLLNKSGRLGFILPSKFFATDYGEGIRRVIMKENALSDVVDFGHAQVFDTATTYTCLLFLAGEANSSINYCKTDPARLVTEQMAFISMDRQNFTASAWHFTTKVEKPLLEKLQTNSLSLNALPTRIGRGSSSGADQVFVLRSTNENSIETRNGTIVDIEKEIMRIPVYATDFGRYRFAPVSGERIIFPYFVDSQGYNLIPEAQFKTDYPKAYAYLNSRREELEKRKQYKAWYGFSAPRNLEVHDAAQMLVPLLADKALYCRLPDKNSKYCLMASGGFSITVNSDKGLKPNYVLGLLNSKFLFWRLRSISNLFRGGWITCTKQYVETLPIRTINFDDPVEKQLHDDIVQLVTDMLDYHKELQKPGFDSAEKKSVERDIADTDRKIDALVYRLYDLTDDEIKIIEGSA